MQLGLSQWVGWTQHSSTAAKDWACLGFPVQEERTAVEEHRQQEEAEEVRRYRKGLRFKAAPLPDFYGRTQS